MPPQPPGHQHAYVGGGKVGGGVASIDQLGVSKAGLLTLLFEMITNLIERNGSFRSGGDAPVLMIERRGDGMSASGFREGTNLRPALL